ncbi:MAG: hypothetical protein LH630_02855 [Actinomycetia bacterium]|nr:hypothetical protein [Actinomycetes bacterium]
MAWWLIPIVATLLAVVWVSWRARPRRPVDPHQSLAAHRRFTEALSPPTPSPEVRSPEVRSPEVRSPEVSKATGQGTQVTPQNRRSV